ncbi:hypothetical protein SAY87_006441 [Trapa incisa]|uniref:Uncharacterized protein n=1 Tax=Trapa incisa TaxID=236973 RepID=A0AAN7K105_9MYRT|nr:hypothetical protein SAY87_006441 [Trapa incisa]
MERPTTILRRSVYTFLRDYHFFTSIAAVLAMPFSASILLSQSSPPLATWPVHGHLWALFKAAGFPSSRLVSLLCLKLSQIVSSFSFTLPCSLTFLLISKAAVILFLCHRSLTFSLSSFLQTYRPLFLTYICNSLVIISVNAAAFGTFFFAFSCLEEIRLQSSSSTLFLSAFGAVFYSVILAHALVVCNFALVLSGTERFGGFDAILKACVLIRDSVPLALFLAIPLNLGWAGIEALFQSRVERAYRVTKGPSFTVALEGLFISYLYSILIVLDTIVSFVFFKSCKLYNYHQLLCSKLEYGFSWPIDVPEEEIRNQSLDGPEKIEAFSGESH